jgi:hypothetical protein
LIETVYGAKCRSSTNVVVAPSGLPLRDDLPAAASTPLGLDEIALPESLADKLHGVAGTPHDEETATEGRTVIKRDPVLHRWGLIPVRCRRDSDATTAVARLPASLLGPMGADFDGDTVSMFAAPKAEVSCFDPWSAAQPSNIGCHDYGDEPMFVPSKQYLFGLHLLITQPGLMERFRQALVDRGAPPWPDKAPPRTP